MVEIGYNRMGFQRYDKIKKSRQFIRRLEETKLNFVKLLLIFVKYYFCLVLVYVITIKFFIRDA